MALAAVIIGWYMIGRFTRGGDAIVAGCAATGYTGMVIGGANKCRGVMAYGTILRGGNMRRRFAGGRCAIVTGGAVIHDARVIKYRG